MPRCGLLGVSRVASESSIGRMRQLVGKESRNSRYNTKSFQVLRMNRNLVILVMLGAGGKMKQTKREGVGSPTFWTRLGKWQLGEMS